MPDVVKSFSNWLKEWQAIVAVIIGVFALGVGWQVVKGDTEAMRDRIEVVEQQIQRINSDRELLIRIDVTVQAMNERVKRIESKNP